MFNWFDLIRQAQGHGDLDAIAKQFNVSTEQAQRAMAAFLPAFAMGLQHVAQPNDMARFFRTLAESPFAGPWGTAMRAFTPQAQQAGKRVLDQLFGSDEVSRRVAHQAADFTGIGVETMQQMLPLMAGIFAGGFHQWIKTQEAAGAFGRPAPQAEPAPSPSAAAGWVDLWSSLLGGQPAAAPAQDKKAPANPFEAMMAAFTPPPQPEAKPAPEPKGQAGPEEMWEQMMGAGREMQKQYLASLQSALEGSWAQKPDKS